MTSAGSLSALNRFSGKDSVLSGPAAGVVGFARVAEQVGYSKSIGFDMGGTSTDVSRYDGTIELEYESKKAGVTLMSPVVAIETVAAGGGLHLWFRRDAINRWSAKCRFPAGPSMLWPWWPR